MEKLPEFLEISEILEKLDDLEKKIFLVKLRRRPSSFEVKDINVFDDIRRRILRLAYDIDYLFYVSDYIFAENGFVLKNVLNEILTESFPLEFTDNDISTSVGQRVERKLKFCVKLYNALKKGINKKLNYYELPIKDNINLENLIEDDKNLKELYSDLINCSKDILHLLEKYIRVLLKLERFMNKNSISKEVLNSIKEGLL